MLDGQGQPGTEPATTTFHCRACGKLACTLTLLFADNPPRAALDADGFLASSREAVAAEAAGSLQAALRAGDARALYALDPLWAPFYCPECAGCYCAAHWT